MAKYGGKKDPTYSAVYFPGRYWYAAMSFVYDFGGQIAQDEGRQVGRHARLAAVARRASTAWRTMALKLSRANKTGDEAHPQQALVFAKGKVGSFIGNGWEWPYALDPKVGNPGLTGKIGAYPMPSHTKGQVHADLPRRLGPRHPGDEQGEGARGRLDRRLHEHGQHDDDGRQGRRDPEHDHARAGSTPRSRRSPRSPRRRRRAGSCRRRRTGRTSRARTCSRRMLSGILRNPGKTKALAKAGERHASRRS